MPYSSKLQLVGERHEHVLDHAQPEVVVVPFRTHVYVALEAMCDGAGEGAGELVGVAPHPVEHGAKVVELVELARGRTAAAVAVVARGHCIAAGAGLGCANDVNRLAKVDFKQKNCESEDERTVRFGGVGGWIDA